MFGRWSTSRHVLRCCCCCCGGGGGLGSGVVWFFQDNLFFIFVLFTSKIVHITLWCTLGAALDFCTATVVRQNDVFVFCCGGGSVVAMQHPRFLVRKHHLTMLLPEYEENCVHRLITLEKERFCTER